MNVKDLMQILEKLNPETIVIVKKDALESGFGCVANTESGVYMLTDYGNDFLPNEVMALGQSEVKAVCLMVEEYISAQPAPPTTTQ